MKKYRDYLKRLPADYTFGIELEFTGGLTSDETELVINHLIEKGVIREGWSVHFDKSVIDEEGKGAEIVSPVLTDTKQTEQELDIILRVIKLIGGKMTDKVGCHIHYGTQCLGSNINNIKNYFKLYTINEPLLYKISKGDLDSVRVGCHEFAKPIQKRLLNVIDSKINSFTELMIMLSINLGANPTHYGENRYYGLNIQRIIEAIRNKPLDSNLEEYIKNIFTGVEQFDKDGKKISPTIEIRYRNGSSSLDEIMCGIRINGQMFVKAKEKTFNNNAIIKSQYRNVKKRKKYIFDKVLRANRESENYVDCIDDEEILRKKFAESIYGDGIIDKNKFVSFIRLLYPELTKDIAIEIYNEYVRGLKPTKYKKIDLQTKTQNIIVNQGRQYTRTAA
jgi:hypothetical protein